MECIVAKKYSAVERTSRQQYVCCECHSAILKGEKYLHCSGLWEFGYDSYRQHLVCAEACEFIRDNLNDHECIAFGELLEYYQQFKQELNYSRTNPDIIRFRPLMAKVLWRRRTQEDGNVK